jgi:YD repeat-containing protein
MISSARLWRKTWPGALVTQFNYDAANRLTSATDPTCTYSAGLRRNSCPSSLPTKMYPSPL